MVKMGEATQTVLEGIQQPTVDLPRIRNVLHYKIMHVVDIELLVCADHQCLRKAEKVCCAICPRSSKITSHNAMIDGDEDIDATFLAKHCTVLKSARELALLIRSHGSLDKPKRPITLSIRIFHQLPLFKQGCLKTELKARYLRFPKHLGLVIKSLYPI
jgi:hypothetical protein